MRRGALVVVVCALAIPLAVLVSWLAAGHDRAEAGNGLGKEVLVHDHHHAAHGLPHALHRLDRARPRASRGMPTAIAVDAALPRVYTASDRARFHFTACTAREEAVLNVQRTPDPITTQREAVLRTLAGFGFITRSIGGVPLPSPDRKYSTGAIVPPTCSAC